MQSESKKVRRDVPPAPRRFGVRPAYVILVVLMGLFAYKFLEKTQEIRQLASQQAAAQYQNDQMAQDNSRLRKQIRYYGTSQYVETQARSIIGYTMPGDVVILPLPVHRRVVAVREAPPAPKQPPAPIWKQWWHAFVP